MQKGGQRKGEEIKKINLLSGWYHEQKHDLVMVHDKEDAVPGSSY
jgi:hypothetical protein